MKKKVLISYHYFAHYRMPIIKELAADSEVAYTFIAGTTTNHKIKILNSADIEKSNISWKIVKNVWLFRKKLLWQSGLMKECLFGDYDCIIFLGNPYSLSTWLAAVLLRVVRRPFFYWAHGIVRNKSRDLIKVVFLKLANGIFLYGNWSRNRLISLGFDPDSLWVIYNSLDYKNQVVIREKLQQDLLELKKKELFKKPNLPVLLFIGRLTIRKKLHELITVCEKLHQMGMPVNVLFVGDGEDKSRLVQLCQSKNLQEYITFYGESYDEQELAPLIALSDVCISPGDVGLTAIHSLTYGTPVITHNNPYDQMPEFEAITPDVTGAFFEYSSTDSLTDTIMKWLQGHMNNREELRKKCYEIIDQFYNPAYQARTIRSVIHNYDIVG